MSKSENKDLIMPVEKVEPQAPMGLDNLLKDIKFNDDGLVPAIAQSVDTGRVLMMAWMNEEAVKQTLNTNYAHYYSRSRKTQWKKGETSGHVQKVLDIFLDCDGDTILLLIEQTGAACHTNRASCFFREKRGDKWVTFEEPIE
nr:phosphoribosyl-AMP cyclohydrolase [Ghiorsea bivora]